MPGEPAIHQVDFGTPLYEAVKQFRFETLRQPLGLVWSAADLAGEAEQIHIAALTDDAVKGAVVLKPLSAAVVKLRQMAVAPDVQGQGLGRKLVAFAEDWTRGAGYGTVETAARKTAAEFCKKLGYYARGNEFMEVTIPHVTMVKDLTAVEQACSA